MKAHALLNGEISVENVSKSFKGQLVLDKLSFHVPAASKVLLVGPSGVGKSTLLRIIAGLELPDEGKIYIGGKLVSDSRWTLEPHRRNIGFVFQNPTLWPHMTIRENIMFGLSSLVPDVAVQRVNTLLEQAQIRHVVDKYPDQISGGEAKRAALIRSIAPHPGFLLVDEPFANLDCPTKDVLLEFLLQTVEELKMTLLYVTHDAQEVQRIGGKVISLPRC